MTPRVASQVRALRVRMAGFAIALVVASGARVAHAQAAIGDSVPPRPGIARLGAVVQQRLQLTDEQTARLRETSRRYADQRKSLMREERDARQTVRDEVARGNAADQARVQSGLDRLYEIQQRRSELAASEQRDLATFLTPTQRAQFAGMQERAFRAAQEIRQRRAVGALGPLAPTDPNRAALNAERRAERQQQRQADQAARRAARQAGRAPR